MGKRPITTGRQLGAAIHDARTRAGLTQAALATNAGVSRKWLIGLEQGARTGAELGKVLAVLNALDLSIQLIERSGSAPLKPDGTEDKQERRTPQKTDTSEKISKQSATEARRALDIMRQATTSSRSTLDAMRIVPQLRPELLETIRIATQPSPELLKTIRQATQITPETLEAIRKTTQLTTFPLKSTHQNEDDES